jgi:hypothetical protein
MGAINDRPAARQRRASCSPWRSPACLVYLYVQDVTQEKHAVLRNFPARRPPALLLRAPRRVLPPVFLSWRPRRDALRPGNAELGLPHGEERGRDHRLRLDLPASRAGALVFVNAPFPVLDEEQRPTPPLPIGEGYCPTPFSGRSLVNVSAMSFGAISRPAVRHCRAARPPPAAGWIPARAACHPIISKGAATSSSRSAPPSTASAMPTDSFPTSACANWLHTNVSVPSRSSCRREPSRARAGVLLGNKVTPEIAEIRGIPLGKDSLSPNRHRDIADIDQLLDQVEHVRAVTGKPVGVKTAIGGSAVHERTHRGCRAPRAARRTRLPDHRWWRGRQRRGATGAGRPHGPVDRRSAAAGGRCTDRQRPEAADSPDRRRQAGHSGARRLGARSGRRFRQHRTRLHVRAGLHPGPALPRQHCPTGVTTHDPACNAAWSSQTRPSGLPPTAAT